MYATHRRSHIGHPIVGDATYDDGALAAAPRMMLHALELTVPLGASILTVKSRDPFPINKKGVLKPLIDFPVAGCEARLESASP